MDVKCKNTQSMANNALTMQFLFAAQTHKANETGREREYALANAFYTTRMSEGAFYILIVFPS